MKFPKLHYIGIDIQIRRDCSYAVIDDTGKLVHSGWFSDSQIEAVNLVNELRATSQVAVGIDGPRMPLPSKRDWYWTGSKRKWRRRKGQTGNGRHCEVVISAHGLANPQWTPLAHEAPEWMKLGFRLYQALDGIADVYEVFPTASYTMLKGNSDVRMDVDFSGCAPGPKDMLDAWVAAATVREFIEGRGVAVGGGDGLGAIILPRPVPNPIQEVMAWPRKCE